MFYGPLGFFLVLKTLTVSGVVLELLCVADSGRFAGAGTTVPCPSGKLLPESSGLNLQRATWGCN